VANQPQDSPLAAPYRACEESAQSFRLFARYQFSHANQAVIGP
jgi:hypothetical protein